MGDVIWSTDFRAKRPPDSQDAQLHALIQAMAPDAVFVDGNGISHFAEMSIEERVRRSIYHGAGLPYPKDKA